MDIPVIVVAFNGFNSYGMVRSLGEGGIRPIVLLPRDDINFVAKSKWVHQVIYYNEKNEIPNILLSSFATQQIRPIVICCEDQLQSIIDMNYNRLSPHFILSNCNKKQGDISRQMDKDIQISLANKTGLDTPSSWHMAIGDSIPNGITFPCIAKPYKSVEGSKSNIRICYNEHQLLEVDKSIEYTIQQFIEKDYEIILWGTSIGNGEYYIPGVTRKIRQFPNVWGLSSYCVLESFDLHPTLNIRNIYKFLRNLGYTGMFSIEMAKKDNKYYFLEINLRNDGKQYFATAAGANLPLLYIKSLLGEKFIQPSVSLPTYAMGELTDFRQVLRKKVGLLKWIKDLFRTKCFFVLNFGDLKPFIYQQYCLRVLKRNPIH